MHKRKANRVHRACFSCRKRKQGCDEQRPCKRCTEKGIECTEAEGPRKRRGDNRGSDEEDIFSDEELSGSHEDGCVSSSEEGEDSGVEAMDSSESADEQPSVVHRRGSHPSIIMRTRSLSTCSMPPSSSPQDSPIPGTPNLSGQESEGEDLPTKHSPHLALLLPFLSSHMDEYSSSESCHSCSEDEEEHDLLTLAKSLKGEDFPFLNSGFQDDHDGLYRDMWFQFLGRAKQDDSLVKEFQKVKGVWADIMRSLRSLQWSKLQTSLIEIEDHLSSASDGEGPAVVYWSSGGRIQYSNQAFSKLVGFSSEELRQCDQRRMISVHNLFHPEDSVRISQKQLDLQLQNREDEGCYYQTKTRLITKMRREVVVNTSISNVRDSYGMPLLTVAHFSTCGPDVKSL
ncbi:hypothetical protein PROFUN_05018 [Planoprotostelium fungivorum]|uniref:Zn(2)-C6 fungal-type domain-containing protein n=1 Tax=Planoprotostelium fungivorum TaxID=1890364 RepID=A0A2P6NS72_9EUKA|nr:hypothetical protein PROFUN_05018 [Planoprotostelium fungivorum]